MPVFDWDAGLSLEQRDTLIEELAQKIHARGMSAPAVLFLEMHRPLAFVASQSLIMGSGFLAPLLGLEYTQRLVKLLESRENIVRLIDRIEELHAAGSHPRRSSSA